MPEDGRYGLFSARPYERTFFDRENSGHSLNYLDAPLDGKTARLAAGSSVVCAFVNDHLNRLTMQILKENGIGLIALRNEENEARMKG